MAVKLNGLCYQRTKNNRSWFNLSIEQLFKICFLQKKKEGKQLGKRSNNREIIAKAIVKDELKYSQEYSEKQAATLLYWYLLT